MRRTGFVVFSLSVVFCALFAYFCGVQVVHASPCTDIDVEIAYNMITNGSFPDLVVLDVRTQSEYDEGHVFGSMWIPHTELEARIDELAGQEDHEIIAYSRSGGRSVIASEILDMHNFTKVHNMLGGILGWESAGYPVWIEVIYIRADGSVDPPTALMQRVGDIYTLTGDIRSTADGIVIERNHLTLDGGDHMLQGAGVRWGTKGIDFSGRTNVTIKNLGIETFHDGVDVHNSSDVTLLGLQITNTYHGIWFISCWNTTISGNNLTANNSTAILIWDTFNSNISENEVLFNGDGIRFSDSSNNIVCRNNIVNSGNNITFGGDGIWLSNSSSNTICANKIMTCREIAVVLVTDSDHNNITGNTIVANEKRGMQIQTSYNRISGNNISNNKWDGISLWHSTYNTISENILANNDWDGIELNDLSDYNAISENNIKGNLDGIFLANSSGNIIFSNNITDQRFGIRLLHASFNNTIYMNNLVANAYNAQSDSDYSNHWDNGSTGNYWSNYENRYPDAENISNVWSIPYKVNDNNIDHYPIIPEYTSLLLLPLLMIVTLLGALNARVFTRKSG